MSERLEIVTLEELPFLKRYMQDPEVGCIRYFDKESTKHVIYYSNSAWVFRALKSERCARDAYAAKENAEKVKQCIAKSFGADGGLYPPGERMAAADLANSAKAVADAVAGVSLITVDASRAAEKARSAANDIVMVARTGCGAAYDYGTKVAAGLRALAENDYIAAAQALNDAARAVRQDCGGFAAGYFSGVSTTTASVVATGAAAFMRVHSNSARVAYRAAAKNFALTLALRAALAGVEESPALATGQDTSPKADGESASAANDLEKQASDAVASVSAVHIADLRVAKAILAAIGADAGAVLAAVEAANLARANATQTCAMVLHRASALLTEAVAEADGHAGGYTGMYEGVKGFLSRIGYGTDERKKLFVISSFFSELNDLLARESRKGLPAWRRGFGLLPARVQCDDGEEPAAITVSRLLDYVEINLYEAEQSQVVSSKAEPDGESSSAEAEPFQASNSRQQPGGDGSQREVNTKQFAEGSRERSGARFGEGDVKKTFESFGKFDNDEAGKKVGASTVDALAREEKGQLAAVAEALRQGWEANNFRTSAVRNKDGKESGLSANKLPASRVHAKSKRTVFDIDSKLSVLPIPAEFRFFSLTHLKEGKVLVSKESNGIAMPAALHDDKIRSVFSSALAFLVEIRYLSRYVSYCLELYEQKSGESDKRKVKAEYELQEELRYLRRRLSAGNMRLQIELSKCAEAGFRDFIEEHLQIGSRVEELDSALERRLHIGSEQVHEANKRSMKVEKLFTMLSSIFISAFISTEIVKTVSEWWAAWYDRTGYDFYAGMQDPKQVELWKEQMAHFDKVWANIGLSVVVVVAACIVIFRMRRLTEEESESLPGKE